MKYKVEPHRTRNKASQKLGKWGCGQDPRVGKEGLLGLRQSQYGETLGRSLAHSGAAERGLAGLDIHFALNS